MLSASSDLGYKDIAKSLTLISTMLLGLSVICSFLGRLAPAFELFSHFRHIYCGTAILLAPCWLWLWGPRRLWPPVLIVLVNVPFLWPYLLGRKIKVPTENISFRVISANILSQNTNDDELFRWVEEKAPDLVLLMEIDRDRLG